MITKPEKQILWYTAKLAYRFISENREALEHNNERVVVKVLKRERRTAEKIFNEVLGESLVDYVVFEIRKPSELEKKMMFFAAITAGYVALSIMIILLVLFKVLTDVYVTLGLYILNVGGFMIGLYIIKDAFKIKNRKLIIMGILVTLLNGCLIIQRINDFFY